ncbi:hypothetical protein ACFU5Z_12240 [Streptomyces sp. NPDC057521]|uniref:hypothetical protein n=1 Tax=Streptomyces sp. NPDC057521 TaxID=3346156 RepID=UPI00367983F5
MPMDMQTYRDGRQAADDAANALRAALAGLGLPERVWVDVRPMVTNSGKPYVHLGMMRADAVAAIAEAIGTPADAGHAAEWPACS